MKVQEGALYNYTVTHDNGLVEFVEHDWEIIKMAQAFGYRSNIGCSHDNLNHKSDACVDCGKGFGHILSEVVIFLENIDGIDFSKDFLEGVRSMSMPEWMKGPMAPFTRLKKTEKDSSEEDTKEIPVPPTQSIQTELSGMSKPPYTGPGSNRYPSAGFHGGVGGYGGYSSTSTVDTLRRVLRRIFEKD